MSFMLSQQLRKVIIALCDDVASPRSQVVKTLVIGGQWKELQELRVRPHDYQCAKSYWKDALVTDLLRKCDIPSGIDKKAAAEQTFLDCEIQNCRSNARLRPFLADHLFLEDQQDAAMLEFIESWRKDVAYVLKALPTYLTPRFGKGSTFGDKGHLITMPDKMSGRPTITANVLSSNLADWRDTMWYEALCVEYPHLSEPEIVRGNRFTSVPKTGLTDRGICIEPSLNLAFQLDVGRLIKTRLRTIGIDLLHGQAVHRDRAQASSLFDSDATIDMSNASDTLCRVLPKLVLPEQWHTLLDSLRSPATLFRGKWFRLEKFSSMGNGFTFELETLIFSTLARRIIACEGGDPDRVSCYGDDLIVPKKHAKSVLAALAFFGFTPNESKTFISGPFRESCGGDYFHGTPVRAHYLERLPSEPQHWISLANGLRRVGLSDPNDPGRFHILKRAWRCCLDAIPSDIRRLRGPTSLGDLVIHDFDHTWQYHDKKGIKCLRVWAPVPIILQWDHWKPTVQLASALLGLPSEGVTPRGGVSGFRVKSVPLYGTDWLPPIHRLGSPDRGLV